MLNRRVLRIKGMQSLFAYYQSFEADFLLAKDYITQQLQPNLNLDVPENKIEMAEKEKEALALLTAWKKDNSIEIENADNRIESTVEESIIHFENLVKQDYKNISTRMLIEIDNLYSNYFLILKLLIEFGDLNPNLYTNEIIEKLRANNPLETEITKRNLSWSDEDQLLKKFNKDVLLKKDNFIEYITKKEHTPEEDKKIIAFLIKEIIFGDEVFVEYFENKDLYWVENKNILKSMVKKTIKENSTEEILQMSPNWEEDKDFFKALFSETIKNESFIDKFIIKESKNWDKDRFALTDLVILKMGITEMISFGSIPVKVSINEYIEISKSYSTPKSKQFINGMLDKASFVLQKEGKIKKSGRGLIDNK